MIQRQQAFGYTFEDQRVVLSPMARGITGEIMHVDAGYHIVGMKNPAAPDLSALIKE